YVDRISGAAFLDAGDAWCTPGQQAVFTGCGGREAAPLVGAGGELIVDMQAILWFRLRAGIGFPIHGAVPGSRPAAYLRFGSYF
ncbi:MAG: hypothetical protein FWJ74_05610, partial [Gemmatimonadota bacterium]